MYKTSEEAPMQGPSPKPQRISKVQAYLHQRQFQKSWLDRKFDGRLKAWAPERDKWPSIPSSRTTKRQIFTSGNVCEWGGSSRGRAQARAPAKAEGPIPLSLRAVPHILQWTKFERKLPCEIQRPEQGFTRTKFTTNWLIVCTTPKFLQTTKRDSIVIQGQWARVQGPHRQRSRGDGLAFLMQ